MVGVGVGGDDPVQLLDAAAAEEIDDLGTGLGVSAVHEEVLSAGLDQGGVPLPDV